MSLTCTVSCERRTGGGGDLGKKACFPPFFARQGRLAHWWDRRPCLSMTELSWEEQPGVCDALRHSDLRFTCSNDEIAILRSHWWDRRPCLSMTELSWEERTEAKTKEVEKIVWISFVKLMK
ncbi:MAG TPA: hypothetical protein PLQ35_03830 [bacterium]|nr:hypothetical protein [bacterium]HQL61401.1 hypothetical protein [bacterium]